MIDSLFVNLVLGTLLGVALGISIFLVFLLLVTFIGSYVYEKRNGERSLCLHS
jgi:hypothetical protein